METGKKELIKALRTSIEATLDSLQGVRLIVLRDELTCILGADEDVDTTLSELTELNIAVSDEFIKQNSPPSIYVSHLITQVFGLIKTHGDLKVKAALDEDREFIYIQDRLIQDLETMVEIIEDSASIL